MKRWLSAIAVVVLGLALVIGVACGGGGEDGGAPGVKTVKMGSGLPLSGIYGTVVGLPTINASEVAHDLMPEFTVAGERYAVKTINEDNAWTGSGGVATATKLIYTDGVKIMHQSGADAAGAAQTICEEAGVIMDMSAAPPNLLGPDNPHTIQLCPNYLMDTVVLFKYVSETYPEVKRVAISFADSAFGHSMGDAAIDAAPYFGLDIVAKEWIPSGMTEFYPLAAKLVDRDPDLVLCDVLVLQPMVEMGYEGKTAYISFAESYMDYIGWENYQGGMIYQFNPYGDDMSQEAVDFFAEIKRRFAEEPSQGPYFTGIMHSIWPQVMEAAGTVDDVDILLETIHSGVSVDTWVGQMRFGGEELIGINSILLWPGAIHEIRGQDYVLVYEMTADEVYELAVEVYGDKYK